MKIESTEEYKKAKHFVRKLVILDSIVGLMLCITLGIFGASIITEVVLILCYVLALYSNAFLIFEIDKGKILAEIEKKVLEDENRILKQERDYTIAETHVLGNELERIGRTE